MTIPTLDLPTLMVAATAVDLLAVLALCFLVRRGRRDREALVEAQRATLDRLRSDLTELVRDAEERTRALDDALASREKRLKALLRDLSARESAPPPRPAKPSGDVRDRLAIDPAEARLLRDLELNLR